MPTTDIPLPLLPTTDQTNRANPLFARMLPAAVAVLLLFTQGTLTAAAPLKRSTVASAKKSHSPILFSPDETDFVQTFSNTTPITIPDSGAASAYPSVINVTGMGGVITNLTVTLTNFSHTWASDVDVLLVGPAGQKVLLMSDVGDSFHATNVTVTLSDAGSSFLPATGTFANGTYKPTDYTDASPGGDNFPAPAPAVLMGLRYLPSTEPTRTVAGHSTFMMMARATKEVSRVAGQ